MEYILIKSIFRKFFTHKNNVFLSDLLTSAKRRTRVISVTKGQSKEEPIVLYIEDSIHSQAL